jgi:hypothetical protein
VTVILHRTPLHVTDGPHSFCCGPGDFRPRACACLSTSVVFQEDVSRGISNLLQLCLPIAQYAAHTVSA